MTSGSEAIENVNAPIPSDVKAVFASYPPEVEEKLLFLRRLIMETADSLPAAGALEETLKWGQPSYLTPQTKSGSTVRLGWKDAQPPHYSIFFKCTADLVPAFKARYPNLFNYGGERSINFGLDDAVPQDELKQCIALALTYHRNKKLDPAQRWEMAAAAL